MTARFGTVIARREGQSRMREGNGEVHECIGEGHGAEMSGSWEASREVSGAMIGLAWSTESEVVGGCRGWRMRFLTGWAGGNGSIDEAVVGGCGGKRWVR